MICDFWCYFVGCGIRSDLAANGTSCLRRHTPIKVRETGLSDPLVECEVRFQIMIFTQGPGSRRRRCWWSAINIAASYWVMLALLSMRCYWGVTIHCTWLRTSALGGWECSAFFRKPWLLPVCFSRVFSVKLHDRERGQLLVPAQGVVRGAAVQRLQPPHRRIQVNVFFILFFFSMTWKICKTRSEIPG